MPGPMRITPELEQFHHDVSRDALEPLWMAAPHVIPWESKSRAVAHLWRREVIERHMRRAAEILSFDNGGDRRVLMLINPGMRDLEPYGWGATTQTLSACVQILLPGEFAPPHRHTQSAIRFIVQGTGAFSTVEGEKVAMSEGDYVITPKRLWHEHGHEGSQPMMWMDCLDTPFVYYMQASWFEPGNGRPQAITRLPSADKYRGGMVRPIGDHVPSAAPLAVYRWEAAAAALRGLRESRPPDPVEGHAVEYINPSDGRSACETIGAWLQELPPGFRGQAHRHVSSAVYHVKEGSGHTVIDGVRLPWSRGDYFCVPSWAWHEHGTAGGAILFSTNDIPIYEKVGLQRSEAYAAGGGHQEVRSAFEPPVAVAAPAPGAS